MNRSTAAVHVKLLLGMMVAGLLVVIVGWVAFSGGGEGMEEPESGVGRRVVIENLPPIVGEGTLLVKHRFAVVNDRPETVHLGEVTASCGCSKTSLEKKTLAPGEETGLNVEVDMGTQGGKRHVTCLVKNDAGEPWSYALNATAYSTVQFHNGLNHASFGVLDPGQGGHRRIELFAHALPDRVPPVVCGVEPGSKDVVATPIEGDVVTLPDGALRRNYVLELRLAPQLTSGNHTDTIAIKYTADGVSGATKVTLAWEVKSVYEVSPQRIHLESSAAAVDRTVTVRRIDGLPLGIRQIKASCPEIQIVAAEPMGSSAQKIAIRVDTKRLAGPLLGSVSMETDHPIQPRIVVPVSVLLDSAFHRPSRGKEKPMVH